MGRLEGTEHTGFGLFFHLFYLSYLFNDLLLISGLTCWIFDGEDVSGFARMTDAGLVLGADLELNLCSLDDVCHSVLTVWA